MAELDLALERFHVCGPEFAGGLSNHGPMAAEALHALGHDALIAAWVDRYAPRLDDRTEGRPIPPEDQVRALGGGECGDWVATFERALKVSPWRQVVRAWLPRLLPGFFAAATHGPIRVAHAIRALEDAETLPRRGELAAALGYWAWRFARLPGEPGSGAEPGTGPSRVLATLPIVDPERRRSGFLVDAVVALDDEPAFAEALAIVDLDTGVPGELLSEICVEAAGLYLENPSQRIAYLHGLTGPAALRLMSGHLDDAELRRGIAYAFQSLAALHATYASEGEPVGRDPEIELLPLSWDELRYRAACSLEEHAIKMTEACWREDRVRPDPRLRLAAADAVANLGASRGSGRA